MEISRCRTRSRSNKEMSADPLVSEKTVKTRRDIRDLDGATMKYVLQDNRPRMMRVEIVLVEVDLFLRLRSSFRSLIQTSFSVTVL